MANPASHATLDFTVDDRVAYSTFARPEVHNSLSEQSLDDLNDVVARVQQDHFLRALVVRGQGDAFCTGLEPELLATAFADLEYYEHVLTRVAATCLSLEALEIPVIGAVNGTASEVASVPRVSSTTATAPAVPMAISARSFVRPDTPRDERRVSFA